MMHCILRREAHLYMSPKFKDIQWRRQDLLRGGAKLKIVSWGTHGGLRGRVVPQLLND